MGDPLYKYLSIKFKRFFKFQKIIDYFEAVPLSQESEANKAIILLNTLNFSILRDIPTFSRGLGKIQLTTEDLFLGIVFYNTSVTRHQLTSSAQKMSNFLFISSYQKILEILAPDSDNLDYNLYENFHSNLKLRVNLRGLLNDSEYKSFLNSLIKTDALYFFTKISLLFDELRYLIKTERSESELEPLLDELVSDIQEFRKVS